MTTVKITKNEKLDMLIGLLDGTFSFDDENIDGDMLIDFCKREKELLAKKAAKAKETAAKKRAESDTLCEVVFAALTDEFESAFDIAERVDAEDATLGKVRNRLTKLVNEGRAVKATAKVTGEDGQKARKIMVYKLADEVEA